MADPFEVRMKFTSYLTHLSANQTSLMKTAHFALKHRDMDEDLHSCILETLEKASNNDGNASSNSNNNASMAAVVGTSSVSGSGSGSASASAVSTSATKTNSTTSTTMNNKANIMYFLDQHADINVKEGGHTAYIDFLRRDIRRIVEAVAVNGANVKVCRRVVAALGDKAVLSREQVDEIESGLRAREDHMARLLGSSTHTANGGDVQADAGVDDADANGHVEVAGRKHRGDVADSNDDDDDDEDEQQQQQQQQQQQHLDGDVEMTTTTDTGTAAAATTVAVAASRSSSNGRRQRERDREQRERAHKVDKRAIEQRIEEDRERNKRLRESVWAIAGAATDEDELDKMWHDDEEEHGHARGGGGGPDDDGQQEEVDIANEEADERRRFARYYYQHYYQQQHQQQQQPPLGLGL